MRTWKQVATLVKTRGLNGRFVARSAAGLPFLLEDGMEVAFVPPQLDVPRRGVVQSVVELDGESYEVAFDTVDERACAHVLVGSRCLVRSEDLDEEALWAQPASWVGWSVQLADGSVVGAVRSIVDNPGQSLIEVAREGLADAYIPLVDEFVRTVDFEAQAIVVDVPAGLLEL